MNDGDSGNDNGRPPRRRVLAGIALLSAAVGVTGGVIVVVVPRDGQPLPDRERLHLLEQSGLPLDFPVHPYARRATQPATGGMTYTLQQAVSDALAWHRDALVRAGYQVYDGDVSGQDEFLPRWLYFSNRTGTGGAMIIRATGRGFDRGTEVKILSTSDARLAPPPLPPGVTLPNR